jgi:hypothetical protein
MPLSLIPVWGVSFFVMCHSSECGSAKWHSSEYHSAWCHCVVLVIIILLSVFLLGVIVLDVILLNVVALYNLQSNIHDFFIFCKKYEIRVFFLFQKSFFSKNLQIFVCFVKLKLHLHVRFQIAIWDCIIALQKTKTGAE